jgi:hypothetical protein
MCTQAAWSSRIVSSCGVMSREIESHQGIECVCIDKMEINCT